MQRTPSRRPRFIFLLTVAFCATPMCVHAQNAPRMNGNWVAAPSDVGTYHHALRRIRCPTSLVGGFHLDHGDEYPGAPDISCTYSIPNTANLLSIYYYPSGGTISEEISRISRPILEGKSNGAEIIQSETSIKYGNEIVRATRVEAAVNGTDIFNSITLLDRDNYRLKIRETYVANPEAIRNASNSFAEMQQEAIESQNTCATMPQLPERNARLAKAMETVVLGSVFHGLTPSAAEDAGPTTPKFCYLGVLEGTDQNLVLKYSTGTQYSFSIAPEASTNSPLVEVRKLEFPADNGRMEISAILVGAGTAQLEVYRGYKTHPSWMQLANDMTSVLSGTLPPIGAIGVSQNGEKTITINSQEIEKEDKGRRRNNPR